VIDAINARKTPSLADARERTCFAVAKEILANKGLSDDSYAAAWGSRAWWRWSQRSAAFR
jgi:hypothetical protein